MIWLVGIVLVLIVIRRIGGDGCGGVVDGGLRIGNDYGCGCGRDHGSAHCCRPP